MIYALVLAGGRSSRMGEDKASLELEGESLLSRTLKTLSEAGAERLLVSGWERPTSDALEVEFIPDEKGFADLDFHQHQGGPPVALYSVLNYLKEKEPLNSAHLLLVVPVDMPLLRAETLKDLLEQSGTKAAVRYANEVFPCVFEVSESLNELIKTGLMSEQLALYEDERLPIESEGKRKLSRFSMKAIFSEMSGLDIALEQKGGEGISAEQFFNVNTQKEWEALKAKSESR